MHSSNHIIKFADDTTVVGLISKNNESAYREEMQQLIAWCKDNNLSLNIDKTKEMVVDFRRAQSSHSLLVINGSSVEIIKSTKFFGVHLAENFTWSLNTTSITKKTQQRLCFLWRLRKPISVPHPDREFVIPHHGASLSKISYHGYRSTQAVCGAAGDYEEHGKSSRLSSSKASAC
ncbi:hypothetical protein QTP86_009900 [Hemibagrus guttatus]|nr:hypothetical protein QTP86_009900 [Hemibagrus guttatus]